MNKYTSYRVDVRSPGADMTTTQVFSAVLRRYSDFLWLYERLQDERPGAIVPPLPEKQPVGRFSPAFVEARRRELERFIRRVAIHPELQDSACLDTFLRADDVTLQAAKNSKTNVVLQQSNMMPHMSVPPQMMMMSPPKKEGFKRWFAETKTSMTGDLVRSPDDELFEEIQRYVHGLDTQMKNVSTQATGLVRKGKEMANGLFEFGMAFNLLGQSEADALGDALCKLGETADRLSVLSAEHADQEAVHFEDPLVDMIKMIHSAKLALHKRHEKRLTYSTCLQEVESKHSQLSKLRTQIGMEAKAYAMEMSLKRAQDAAEVAREDFAGVSQRVLREVDRFKRETTEDMRRTVLEYIQLQVEYNKRMEEIWANLIPQLERVQLDSNSNIVGGDGQSPAAGSTQFHQTQGRLSEPQINSEPVATPNPQQAMTNGFYGHQQQQGMLQDPGMFVQYRQD
jgi:sorting nexin-1/2